MIECVCGIKFKVAVFINKELKEPKLTDKCICGNEYELKGLSKKFPDTKGDIEIKLVECR